MRLKTEREMKRKSQNSNELKKEKKKLTLLENL
jgi:hypothetical protein